MISPLAMRGRVGEDGGERACSASRCEGKHTRLRALAGPGCANSVSLEWHRIVNHTVRSWGGSPVRKIRRPLFRRPLRSSLWGLLSFESPSDSPAADLPSYYLVFSAEWEHEIEFS